MRGRIVWYIYGMAIYNEIKNTERGGGKESLILEITNDHKETIKDLVKAYKIKDGDEAKLIAFLIAVASHEDVKGKPLGNGIKVFLPQEDWIAH